MRTKFELAAFCTIPTESTAHGAFLYRFVCFLVFGWTPLSVGMQWMPGPVLSVSVCVCVSCVLLQNRGRLAEKRTIPLPPNRVPKKELASVFSSDESEGGERSSTDHADIKQEEELHYTTMRKRWVSVHLCNTLIKSSIYFMVITIEISIWAVLKRRPVLLYTHILHYIQTDTHPQLISAHTCT